MIVGNVNSSLSLLRGKAEPLMNRPGQMMGIPSPEGSNFFHPDGLPTWMRPSALPEKFRSPSVPSGGGAMVPASMPVAPAMGINGDAYQNPGQLPSGVPSAGLGGMYGSQLDIIQHWVQSVQQLHQVYQEEPVYHSSKIFNFCDVMKKRESVFVKIKFKKK